MNRFWRRCYEGVARPLRAILNKYEEGRVLREGLTLVLVGKPNVGKSSMLNALLGKDRAIVTAAPGTTRDVIEDTFLLKGVQVRILDTAGIRNQPDEIESCGIEMTIRSVSEADVVLWLIDNSRPLTSEDQKVYEAVGGSRCIVLLNKSDLASGVPDRKSPATLSRSGPGLQAIRKESLRHRAPQDLHGRGVHHAATGELQIGNRAEHEAERMSRKGNERPPKG